MKIKFLTKTFTIVLAAALAAGACACDNGDKNGNSASAYEVWSTYNTVKVIQQTQKNDEYVKLPAELNISMMQGEYEGAQLIVTSNADTQYTLEAGELKSAAGETIPAGNVAIYQQKYLTLDRTYNRNPDFSAGESVPDMLLPMDIAERCGENVIPAGTNRGITVEICSEGVQPGIYTGKFRLTVGDESRYIPVTAEVWDISYSGRRTFKTSFLIYRENLVYGEYANDYELTDRYIDFLSKYKIDSYVVRDNDAERRFEDSMKKYAANKNQSSIVIPVDFKTNYTASADNAQYNEAINYIVKLAVASTEEVMYVDGAYFYPSSYDEADINENRQKPAENLYGKNGELVKTLKGAVAKLKADAEFAEKDEALKERIYQAVLNIPAVFTNVNYVDKWVKSLDGATFCPYVNVYDDHATLQRYQDHAEDYNNGNLWMYTANESAWPYPTLDVDDGALGLRVNGWMANNAGVNGYLYWSVNLYHNANEYVDVYGSPDRGFTANGDGFLLYPGRYYGSEYPFASLRLSAFRDGLDDYDMLSAYRQILDAKAEKYGFKYNFSDYVSDLYASLFSGMRATCTDETFYNARTGLARRILAEKNAEYAAVTEREENRISLNIYTASADVQINGEKVTGVPSGEGYKYVAGHGNEKAKTFVVTVGDKETTYTLNGIKTLFASEATLSEGSVYNDGVITVKALEGEVIEVLRPSIKFSLRGVRAKTLCFTYGNAGETDITLRVSLLTSSGKKIADTNYCPPSGSREVRIEFAEDIDWNDVTGVEISFDNAVMTETGSALSPDRAIKLGTLYFELI